MTNIYYGDMYNRFYGLTITFGHPPSQKELRYQANLILSGRKPWRIYCDYIQELDNMINKIRTRRLRRGQTKFPKRVNNHDFKPQERNCSYCQAAFGSHKFSGKWYPRARINNSKQSLRYFGYDSQFNIVC